LSGLNCFVRRRETQPRWWLMKRADSAIPIFIEILTSFA